MHNVFVCRRRVGFYGGALMANILTAGGQGPSLPPFRQALCQSLTLVITFANCPRLVRAFYVRNVFDITRLIPARWEGDNILEEVIKGN